MSGLFGGIIGSLIGAGLQATFGGISIGEDANQALDVLRRGGVPVPPDNWFSQSSNSNGRKTEQVCDKYGEHVARIFQALGPGMQIATTLKDVVYPQSQPSAARARRPQEEFTRSNSTWKPGDKCSCKGTSSTFKSVNSPIMENREPKENFYTERLKTGKSENVRQKSNRKIESESWIIDQVLTDPRERDIKTDKFMMNGGICKDLKRSPPCRSSTVTKQSRNPVKYENNFGKSSRTKKCQVCHTQINNVKKPSLMPNCGHFICHGCVQTSRRLFKCPICGLIFN